MRNIQTRLQGLIDDNSSSVHPGMLLDVGRAHGSNLQLPAVHLGRPGRQCRCLLQAGCCMRPAGLAALLELRGRHIYHHNRSMQACLPR